MLKNLCLFALGHNLPIYHNKVNIFFLFTQIFTAYIEIKLYTFYQQSY